MGGGGGERRINRRDLTSFEIAIVLGASARFVTWCDMVARRGPSEAPSGRRQEAPAAHRLRRRSLPRQHRLPFSRPPAPRSRQGPALQSCAPPCTPRPDRLHPPSRRHTSRELSAACSAAPRFHSPVIRRTAAAFADQVRHVAGHPLVSNSIQSTSADASPRHLLIFRRPETIHVLQYTSNRKYACGCLSALAPCFRLVSLFGSCFIFYNLKI